METRKQIKTPSDLFSHINKIYPDVFMGGSLLLKNYGLLEREPKDVDINTNNSEFLKLSEQLSKISPCKNQSYYPNDGHFRFHLNGIDVCVFDLQGKDKFTLQQVIEAKQKYAGTKTPSGKKHLNDLKIMQNKLDQSPGIKTLLIDSHQISENFSIHPVLINDELPF